MRPQNTTKYLEGCGGCTYEQPQGLSHQGCHGAQGSEEDEAQRVRGLGSHPVHDAAVSHREHDLQGQALGVSPWQPGAVPLLL